MFLQEDNVAPGPPLHFLFNPWHTIKMLLSPPAYDNSKEIPTSKEDTESYPTQLLTKKNHLNILKSAFLFSNYARAGKRLRKLKELKKALTEKAEKNKGTSDPSIKLMMAG